MKKIVVMFLLISGSVTFAQPTSGDLSMEAVEGADSTLIVYAAPQQSFETAIVSAFKAGSSAKIAIYFGDNVDLSILGKANLYSKSQAQQVLQHFFTENPPTNFEIVHKGKGKSSQYFIGKLTAKNGKKFRVTINSKTEGDKKTINALTIEAE